MKRKTGQKQRTEIQDRNKGQKYRTEIQNRNTGQKYQTEIQDRNTGQKYRTEIQDRNTGQKYTTEYRTEIQDRNTGQKYRTKGHLPSAVGRPSQLAQQRRLEQLQEMFELDSHQTRIRHPDLLKFLKIHLNKNIYRTESLTQYYY